VPLDFAALPASREARLPEIARQFARQLETLHVRKSGAALTLVGPHRDEVRFFITRNHTPNAAPIDAITYASRGQGRTMPCRSNWRRWS
jgi:recombinational DNA repair ATPase RecF